VKNQWAKLGGVIGIVYCLVGFVLIFLGWNGAASYDRVEQQMPYVVSGGLAGLGLVVVGAALMVAYSLRSDRVELKASIDELRRAVAAADPPAARTAAAGEVLAGSSSYHRPDCTLAATQDAAVPMSRADAEARGLAPCRVCHPDQPAAGATS